MAREAGRGRGRSQRRPDGQVSRDRRAVRIEEIKAGLRERTIRRSRSASCCAARRSRTRASRRCSTRSSTTCRRRSTVPPVKGIDEDGERRHAPGHGRRAVLRAGVQDHERPVRRQADVLPRLLRRAELRRLRCSTRSRAKKERIGRLLQMHANDREEIKEVRAGDIAAAVGLKDVTTGDTLCDPDKHHHARADGLPGAGHLDRRRAEDQGRPGKDGRRAAAPGEGRSVVPRAAPTRRSGQTIISGMGELHLEIIVDRMKREFKVEANVGKPQVAYRETIRKARSKSKANSCASPAAAASTAMSGSSSNRRNAGKGYEFVNEIVGGVVPREYIPADRQGRQGSDEERRPRRLSRSSTSRSRSSTVRTTTSTPPKWRSRSPVRWRSRKACAGRSPCCSSRS